MEKMNALYVPKDISDELTPYQMDRRNFVKGGLAFLTLAAIGCVTTPKAPPVPLTEGMPNTLTYVNDKGEKETVYDLRGVWDAEYNDYGYGTSRQEVSINQNEREFLGKKTKGGVWVPTGHETVKGILKNDGFEKAYVFDSEEGWVKVRSKIRESGNKLLFDYHAFSIRLWRKD